MTGIQLYGIFKKVQFFKNVAYILINNDGDIDSISSSFFFFEWWIVFFQGCINFLNLDPKTIQKGTIKKNITEFVQIIILI